MDFSEGGDLITTEQEGECMLPVSVEVSGSPCPASPHSVAANLMHGVIQDGRADLMGVEGEGLNASTVPGPGAERADVDKESQKQGVTAKDSTAVFCPPGQLGTQHLTERFKRMVTGVEDGPRPSRDAKKLSTLNFQDLRDIKEAVCALNVSTNPAECGETGLPQLG
jgi:hypothetical protein